MHSVDNVADFNKWKDRLEELGYKNYFQDLIATDYGIPQTRNRCFMISILGDYSYTFPKPIPLKLKLKDMLEDNVEEKYYLSEKMLNGMINTNFNSYKLESRLQDLNGTVDTILTSSGSRCPHCIPIKNATAKGYLEAEAGDGVDISSRMEYHRGTVQKGKTQTLTTMGGENNGVVVGTYDYHQSDNYIGERDRKHLGKETSDTLLASGHHNTLLIKATTPQVLGEVVVIGNYSPSNHEASRIVDSNYSAPTFKENHGTINAIKTSDLRIRKLTPCECFALMGVKKEDYLKCAKNQSDSSLYHLAGDSIVCDVLCHIFKELL